MQQLDTSYISHISCFLFKFDHLSLTVISFKLEDLIAIPLICCNLHRLSIVFQSGIWLNISSGQKKHVSKIKALLKS